MGLYHKTFYGRNCYCIAVSWSVCTAIHQIRLRWKGMGVVNTLTYYNKVTITVVNSFITTKTQVNNAPKFITTVKKFQDTERSAQCYKTF
jgi:hypothetical protein